MKPKQQMTLNILKDGQTNSDAQQLVEELQIALNAVDSDLLKNWGLDCIVIFKDGLVRRGVTLGQLGLKAVSFSWREFKDGFQATRHRKLKSHLSARKIQTINNLGQMTQTIGNGTSNFVKLFKTDPAQAAPILLGATLGFVAGSGGLDGDGGVPDLDLLPGIGHHRSIYRGGPQILDKMLRWT